MPITISPAVPNIVINGNTYTNSDFESNLPGTLGELANDIATVAAAVGAVDYTGGVNFSGDVVFEANASFTSNYTITRLLGTAAAGSSNAAFWYTEFTGNATLSNVNGSLDSITILGVNDVGITRGRALQVNLDASLTGDVSQINVVDGDINHNSSGFVTTSSIFYGAPEIQSTGGFGTVSIFSAGSPVFASTGEINIIYGLHVLNLGHATKVNTQAIGILVEDFTNGSTFSSAFYSQMTSGTGKWGIFLDGNADNLLTGNTKFGFAGAPTEAVDVSGRVLATVTGSGVTEIALRLKNSGTDATNSAVGIDLDPGNGGLGIKSVQLTAIRKGDNSTDFQVAPSSPSTNSAVAYILRSDGMQLIPYGAGTLTTDASGNVTATSDDRLKNLKDGFTRGLEALKDIVPIVYNWNAKSGYDRGTDYVGFSAQNIRDCIPEAVGQNPNGMLTLSDRPIVATIINAIKDLDRRLVELEDKISKL